MIGGPEMTRRLDYGKIAPGALEAMLGLERYGRESGLEDSLIELVKVRASQINRCAYCIDMHTKDALAAGETPQRLFLLDAWREAPAFYTDRDRAARAWTEAVTEIAAAAASEEPDDGVRAACAERERV